MLNPTAKTKIKARIARYEALLDAAEEQLLSLTEVEDFKIDTGEGSQRTKFRKMEDLRKSIRSYEIMIDHLYQRLNGAGLSNITLRRK